MEDWEKRLEDFYFEREKVLPDQKVGIDIDDWKEFIQQEIDKAREEGYEIELKKSKEVEDIVDELTKYMSDKWVDTNDIIEFFEIVRKLQLASEKKGRLSKLTKK